MKKEKYLLTIGSLLLSVSLIISVPLVDVLLSLFNGKRDNPANPLAYTTRQVVAGIVSEVVRAIITCYLYSTTAGKGSSIKHAICYGLLYSALIASLYIILGGFYFNVENPVRFIIQDSLILIIQGAGTGLVLYPVYKERHNE